MKRAVVGAFGMCMVVVVGFAADPPSLLTVHTRARQETVPGSGDWQMKYKALEWTPRKTAIIVCDMWQRHWCDGAAGRGGEMASRINDFIGEARRRGALIVHSPSSGMEFYHKHPARQRAQGAPKAANLPKGIEGWCNQIESEKNVKWPIDQSDGGCDCQPHCPDGPMDVHQTSAIKIHEEDAISDSGVEIWNLFAQREIENVILLGVHTNMCVIGRPFGLRNMVRFGKNVVLVRDLTDTMYNPRKAPLVSHVRGTELMIEYIEKHVCSTITSSDLLGGPAFRFREDTRPHVAMIVSEDEYGSQETLPAFAQMLRERYGCYCTVAQGEAKSDISGLDELQSADVAVLFVRRRALPQEQLDKIRACLNAGKPLVALRTASHAFSINDQSPAGCDQWPSFDAEVLGGNYHGHGNGRTEVRVAPDAGGHPLLNGVQPPDWTSQGTLYFVSPIDKQTHVLLTGSAEGKTEPVAWTRTHQGGRVFYSSLGHRDDFKTSQFRTLLSNAIFWAMDRPRPHPESAQRGS